MGLSEEDLVSKLQARWDARLEKDWPTADSIRDELKNLDFSINDRSQSWRCTRSGRAGSTKPPDFMKPPPARDSSRGGSSHGGDELMAEGGMPEKEIIRLLIDREVARQDKDYAEADKIRDMLKEKDVFVSDRDRSWRCDDGRGGARPNATDTVDGFLANQEKYGRGGGSSRLGGARQPAAIGSGPKGHATGGGALRQG